MKTKNFSKPLKIILLCLLLIWACTGYAQSAIPKSNEQTIPKDSFAKKERKVVISGMAIARYAQSFDKAIDVNGKYHSGQDAYATSSFAVRRVRIQAKAQLTSKADAAVLLNLSDFIGNPSNKVLENAFLKYHFNDYFNVQIGQFRPYFGREDLYPEELLQTLEWSNQYAAFGANGWQGFQTGATVFGKTSFLKLPLSYYIGVFNGNGRNQPMDNDNGKLFPARLEFSLHKNTKLGLNGGLGKDGREKVWTFNADIDHVVKLGTQWELEIQSEYKRGTNNSMFDTTAESLKEMKNFQLAGLYVLPNLKYSINNAEIKSLELSMRYETLNCDIQRKGRARKTCMPMFCVQLADEYFLRFELGAILDRYQNAISAKDHNSTRLVCQVKARF